MATKVSIDSYVEQIVAAATDPSDAFRRVVREVLERATGRQSKPRRAELYPLPPDSMLTLTDEDREWLHTNAPHVPDYDRATQKWFLREQASNGRSKPLSAWRASWQKYMITYSDSEISRNGNGNGTNSNSRNSRVSSSPGKGVDGAIWDRSRRA